jgi:polysaccharide biosynthesis protein PslG
MVHRLRRFLLPLTCVCVLAGAALPAGAGAKAAVGISDNGPGMFSSHLFNRLNITTARLVVDWNVAVMRNKSQLNAARAWIRAAERDGVQPLISFGGDSGAAGNYIPPTSVYTAAIKAFLHDFPEIKNYTPWNEPDWIYRPRLAYNPALAASYFNALIRWCHHCTVAAGDVYLPNPQLGSWIRAYKRYLNATPKGWAIHNYYDVRTFSSGQIRTLQSLTSGQIWLTEIGGVIRRGHWQYGNQSPAAAGRDEGYLFSMPSKFHRITRIYHYQWQGTVDTPSTGWDSGLIGPGGVPRPAYWPLAQAAGLRRAKDRAHR